MQAARPDDFDMLQIALTPAAIAQRVIDHRRGCFFKAAVIIGQQVDAPAGAAHQRRLDEIMTQHQTAEGWPTGQMGQAGMPGKRAQANDGVVAPVVAVAEIPPGQARCQHRPVTGTGELMGTREQRIAIHQPWNGLDDAGVRIGLHEAREAHHRVTAHHAVGIEHQHLLIVPAPAATEFGEIASLARGVLVAAAIEEPAIGAEPAAT